ncbi:hypothetical protein EV426DRAFT_541651, partial [Tirmania nivea]
FQNLSWLVDGNIRVAWKIPKTMVFLDNCALTQDIAGYLRSLLSKELVPFGRSLIRAYHGRLELETREDIFEALSCGDCRILIYTDSCGMGLDLPDI